MAITTDINLYFNETIGLTTVIVIDDSGPDDLVIEWDVLDVKDRERFLEVINAYGGALPVPAQAGYQVVDYNGTAIGANPTGLMNDATTYTATIQVDGVDILISIVGSAAQTFTTLVAAIDTDLGANATATIDANDNIRIESATGGLGGDVLITSRTDLLFSKATGYVQLNVARPGVNNFKDAIVLNLGDNGQSLWYTYRYALRQNLSKPIIRHGLNANTVYWNGTDWKYYLTDVTVT